MAEPSYPPPPPESPPAKAGNGPETGFFIGIKRRLAALEQRPQLPLGRGLKKGLIVALVLGATLSMALSLAAQLGSGLDTNDWPLMAIVAPLTEEIFKGLSILIVARFMWKTIPSSRYGAALGAATGLGFAIAETIIYTVGASGDAILFVALSRIVAEPFMHPLWSAFAGVGFFAFLARKSSGKSAEVAMGLLFVLTGLFAHSLEFLRIHIAWSYWPRCGPGFDCPCFRHNPKEILRRPFQLPELLRIIA